ncbi:MAG: hypothetical protein ACTHJ0_08245 [Flavipsychrobacter sp.]
MDKTNKIINAGGKSGSYYWAEQSSIGNDTTYFSRTKPFSDDTVRLIDSFNAKFIEILSFSKSRKRYIHFKSVMGNGYDIQRFVSDTAIMVGETKIIVRKYYVNKSMTTDAELLLYYSPRLGLFMRISPDWLSKRILHTDSAALNDLIDSAIFKLRHW